MTGPGPKVVPDHYLRHNQMDWTPRHLIVLDTETLPRPARAGELHTLRLWVAAHVARGATLEEEPAWEWGEGYTRAGLADWVNGLAGSRHSFWLYCQNLSFDLTVTDLIGQLHRRGWTLGEFHFAGRGVTGTMAKGNRTIHLCDSYSLFHKPLGRLGELLRRPKLPMPLFDAPTEDWLVYCRRDTEVLGQAVLQALGWWEENALGRWSATGAALGWNAARHLEPPPRILIKTHPEGIAADRAAVYGGRRDVSRMGLIGKGPYVLLDFANAYATVAAHCLLPWQRRARLTGPQVWARLAAKAPYGCLATVTVNTPEPLYPCRTDRGVFYPVGTFATTLAGPELDHAFTAGHLIDVEGGWYHQLGWELRPWGQWILGLLDLPDGELPPMARLMAHQWGRSVIGKFGQRAARREDRGPALWPWWHLERGVDAGTHTSAADVHLAGRHFWYTFDTDGDNAYPAVLAWVESVVRLKLGLMLHALGEGVWVSANTDGAILDVAACRRWLREGPVGLPAGLGPVAVGNRVGDALAELTWPLRARVKAVGRHLEVVGPQHYRSTGFQSWAGRPGAVEVDEDGNQVVWAWPAAKWQMAHGDPAGFVRVRQQWTDPVALAYRWVLEDGTALPVRIAGGDDGGAGVVPWNLMPEAECVGHLSPDQAPALRGLY